MTRFSDRNHPHAKFSDPEPARRATYRPTGCFLTARELLSREATMTKLLRSPWTFAGAAYLGLLTYIFVLH